MKMESMGEGGLKMAKKIIGGLLDPFNKGKNWVICTRFFTYRRNPFAAVPMALVWCTD